ncbi:hypothetical protein Tco_0033772 [Tanacetum coccineum]
MGRDTIQLEDVVSTISKEYLLEFTSEYGIPESLHPELPGLEEPIVEFPEGKVGVYTKFFDFANYHIPISQFLFDILDMDLFNLISDPNPTKVKTGTRPRAVHEVLLLTTTASRVIDMEDTVVVSGSSWTPPTLKKSMLDFANKDPPQIITERGRMKDQVQDGLSPEIPPVENETTTEDVLEPANALPKVWRKDHAALCPAHSTLERKSLASMGLDAGSIISTPATQDAPTTAKNVSNLDPLSYSKPETATEIPTRNVATTDVRDLFSAESLKLGKSTSFPSLDGSPGARQVAMGSQLMLRFKEEVRLLKKAIAKIAKRDQRIQAREEEIKKLDQEIKSFRNVEAKVHDLHNQTKNLETRLEGEVDIKKVAEAKNAGLAKELESLHNRVEQHCTEMDARMDKLSVDFDEELYPHMLTAIAGRRWVIGHGLHLAVMKCAESVELRQAFADVVSAGLIKGMSEGLKHDIEHGKAGRDLAAVEA